MRKIRFWLATIAVLLCSVSVKAQWGDIFGYDFGVDGVYYNITSDFTVEVTNSLWARYSGIIEIPSNVTYNNINYSVTGIGEDTFNGCINLTSVTIPNSVTSIGKKAFFECSLASITIPNTVKHIGEEAFEGSTWWNNQPNGVVYLQKCLVGHKGEEFANGEIKIKDGTMTIANCALESCYTLTKVTIPSSLEYIGENAFYFCKNLKTIINFSNINISKGSSSNGRIAVYADLVINADEQLGDFFFLTTLEGYHYLVGYLGNENDLMLPENYKGENYRIGNNAFENNSLKSISIPNSVIGIENEAFRNCSNLTNIVIPNSVTSIGSSAFYGCSGLTNIIIPNSVIGIENEAFRNCSNLTNIVIPNSVTSIGSSAFYGCSGLTNIIIPNSVTSIGSSAFYGCSGLTNIIIPNSVTSIGSKVFERCKNLYTIINFSELEVENNSYTKIILNGNKNKQIEDFFFSTDENGIHHLSAYIGVKENIELPKDYKGESYKINNYVFYNHTELTSIVIPNSVTKIGDSAFSGCSKLASISIPSSVTSIGVGAFYGCSNLTAVHITDLKAWCDITFKIDSYSDYIHYSNPLYYAKHLYLNGEEIKDLEIPNSVTSINSNAFEGCSGLTSVTIGNSVTSIGDKAFYNCSNLKTVINFSDLELSTGSKSHGYVGYYASKVINADEQVGDFFFRTDTDGYRYLSGYIGNDTDLTLPNDYKGTDYKIGSSVFSGCSGLTSITIPNSVTSIGSSAFGGCKGLTSVTIPNSVTSIGNNVFYNCSGLTSITIPNSVTSIGNKAFYGCNQLNKLIIEDGSMSIFLNDEQFIDCPLEYVYIGRDFYYHDNYVHKLFKEGNTLKTAVIGPKVSKIEFYLFSGCSGLTSVSIPNSVTSIGAGAFEDCTGLKELYIGNSITSIPTNLISGCSALEKLYIGTSVKNIGNNLLTGCTNLNTLSVGAKIPPTVNDLGLGSQQYFTVKLQVPEGSKAMYQFADAWKKFFNIEEFDPATGIAEVTPDAEEKNLPIYNLQGTRMTEEKENLPTGIYIQGGKKIFIK